jgi:hypothetical protein
MIDQWREHYHSCYNTVMHKKKLLLLIIFAVVAVMTSFIYSYISARTPGSYVGMTESKAVSRAERYRIDYQFTRKDNEKFKVPMDIRPRRINFEVDKGMITDAYGE